MLKQNKKPATNVEDPQRRELLTRAAKLAVYTAPAITVLTFASNVHAQVSGYNPPAPPGPGGRTTAEDIKKKGPDRRR